MIETEVNVCNLSAYESILAQLRIYIYLWKYMVGHLDQWSEQFIVIHIA